MKKKIFLLPILILFFYLPSCSSHSSSVFISPKFQKFKPETFAILPFNDARSDKSYRAEAPLLLTDAFETAFMSLGHSVLERRTIGKVLDEIKFSYQGNVDVDQLNEMGKMTNSDVVVLGFLRAFHPALYENNNAPGKPTSCSTISFSVKAIHIKSGEILWKASVTKSSGGKSPFSAPCNYDLLRYVDQVANETVSKINKKLSR
ncbi:MAG: hypothetical protein ACE5FU_09925 [Nitrospinota bacterium]